MNNCDTNIVTLSQCEDIFVSSVGYNTETEILTVVLNDGTIYTASIPTSAVEISEQSGNQIVELIDGLFVAKPSFGINSLAYENGNNLLITSSDDSMDITVSKVGTQITVDLSCVNCGDGGENSHPSLTVNPNLSYSFDQSNQILNLPLPTLVQTATNVYTYTANNGTAAVYTLTFHPSLTINTDVTYSWNPSTQVLNLPLPTLTNNGNGTYTYDPGDGNASFIINTSNSLSVNFGVPQNFNNITQTLNLPTPTLTDNGNFTFTYNPGDGTDSIILQEFPEGVSNLTSSSLVGALSQLAGKSTPWAKENLLQPTTDISITISEDIYHSGNVGIGIDQTETIQGKTEVKGDIYISTDGAEAKQYFQVERNGSSANVIQSLKKLATKYQVQLKNSTNMLTTVDDDGNLGIGEVSAITTLPDNMYDGQGTFTISNYNGNLPPAVPISVFSVTEFVLIV